MKNLLKMFGLIKEKKEMTLDEYIVSIRPASVELSQTYLSVHPVKNTAERKINKKDDDNGPEEAGCLVLA